MWSIYIIDYFVAAALSIPGYFVYMIVLYILSDMNLVHRVFGV